MMLDQLFESAVTNVFLKFIRWINEHCQNRSKDFFRHGLEGCVRGDNDGGMNKVSHTVVTRATNNHFSILGRLCKVHIGLDLVKCNLVDDIADKVGGFYRR